MAKRFTDTDKWKKPFIRGLEGAYKLLWLYILDDCDHAGIWPVDFEVAQIRTGQKFSEKKAIELFGDRIEIFADGSKWFLRDFIDFQYGDLKETNRMHLSVIQILTKNNLAPYKPLLGAQGKGQGIIQGNEQGLGQGQIQPPKEIIQDETLIEWQRWGQMIVSESDQYWEQMKGRKVTQPEMDAFLSVASRNDWKMTTQQQFRISLKGFDWNQFRNGKDIKKPLFDLSKI